MSIPPEAVPDPVAGLLEVSGLRTNPFALDTDAVQGRLARGLDVIFTDDGIGEVKGAF